MTTTQKAKEISLKWKLLASKGERGWGGGRIVRSGKEKGEWEMEKARQTITNSHN